MSAIFWNVNADGTWDTTADWNTGVLPASSDDVTVNTAALHTVTFDSGTATVHSLTVGNDDFVISGGSLGLSAASSFAHALTMNGTLSLAGNTSVTGLYTGGDNSAVSNTSTLTLAGGASFGSYVQFTGSGTTVLEGASTIGNADGVYLDGGQTLENEGTLTVTNNGLISLGRHHTGTTIGGGTLQNDAGATIIFNKTLSETVDSLSGTTAFKNAGTMQVSGAAGARISAAFTNTGMVSVTQGTLEFTQGGSSAASGFTLASGTTLKIDSAGFTMTGGTLGSAGSTVDLYFGPLTITAPTTIVSALRMTSGGLSMTSNTMVTGPVTAFMAVVTNKATLTLADGASFSSSNTFKGSGTTVLQGSTKPDANSVLYIDGGQTLENQGTLTLKSAGVALGFTIGSGTLKNDAGATIILNNPNASQDTGAISAFSGTTAFINAGTVQSNGAGQNNITIGATLTNTGTVSVTQGQLVLSNGGSSAVSGLLVASGAALEIFKGFTFSGGGTLGSAGSTVRLAGATVSTTAATTFGGALDEGAAKLMLTGNTTVAGLFTEGNGRVSNAATLTLAGGAFFGATDSPDSTVGVLTGSGTTVLQGATSFSSGSSMDLDGGQTLENKGTLTEAGNSILLGNNPYDTTIGGGTLKNDVGATIVFNNSSTNTAVQAGTGTTAFINAGTVQKTGTGETQITAAFTNTGVVSVTHGQLDLDGGGSSTANGISIASGASVVINDGSFFDMFTLSGGGTLGSAGSTFVAYDGTVNVTGSMTFGGNLQVGGPSNAEVATLALGANTVAVTGKFSTPSVATISGTGKLTLAGGTTIGGTTAMTGSGTTVFQGATSVSQLGVDGGRTLENQGTLTETGSATIILGSNPFDTAIGDGTLKNDAGATIVFNYSSQHTAVGANLGTTAFTNAGTIQNTGTSEADITAAFTNTGTVQVTGGELHVTAAMTGTGIVTVNSGASFVLDASATTLANSVNIASGTGFASLTGGSGGDLFKFGGNLLASDKIDGGSGADTVMLAGDYTAGVVFGAATMVNVETLSLGAGFSYKLTTNDATVAAGQMLKVDASALGAGNGLTFDGSAETNGAFNFIAGAGADALIGGSGNDLFKFGGNFLASDMINGGAGADTVMLSGDYAATPLVFGATTMVNVETLSLGAGFSYKLTSNDATVAAGQTLTVNASALGTGNGLTFDGSAETNGAFNFVAGAGADALTGGLGADRFSFAAGTLTAADTANGGTGTAIDTLLFTTAGAVAASAFQNVSHIEQIILANGTNNLTLSDALVSTADDGHLLTVIGGSGNDTINAAAVTTTTNRVFITAGSGSDTLTGGFGADTFYFTAADLTSADTVNGNGGAAIDRIVFTTAGTIAASTFTNVSHIEQLLLANGTNSVTLADAMVAASDNSHILTVAGGTGNDTVNANALTANDRAYITAGSGNDTLTGGAGLDVFYFAAADLTSLDTVTGGTGTPLDVLTFTTAGTVAASAFANISHIEQLYLASGTNSIALSDALAGSTDDSHVLTVHGSTGNDTIDASAVTTAANQIHFLSGAGTDTLTGGAGADIFFFAPADLTSADTVNGGTGTAIDSIVFIAAGTVTASAFTNVSHIEQIGLANGTNTLSLTDALVGSADDGHIFYVTGGSGNDTVNASAVFTAANRVFFTAGGGNDTLTGGAGADTFYFTAGNLTAADAVSGGSGAAVDRIVFTTAGTIGATAFDDVGHIEQIVLANGTNNVTLSNALVGSADDNHVFYVTGGTGADTINASAVTTATYSVHFSGGSGADVLTAGAGADLFTYAAAGDSTSTGYDTITGFNFAADHFDIPGGAGTITLVEAARTGALDSGANFDTELAARFSTLAGHHAGLFTASSGSLNGQTFLVVDLNGTAGYQAGADLVLHLVSPTGTLVTGDFI